MRRGATEPRGVSQKFGGFLDHTAPGAYLCAGCSSPLYESRTKFECGCGWIAFWDCIPGAVFERPDPDGVRTEILCNRCRGHLGHVVRGEEYGNPAPDERHCVASLCFKFAPAEGGEEILPQYNGPVYLAGARPSTERTNAFGTVYTNLCGGGPPPADLEDVGGAWFRLWAVCTDARRLYIQCVPPNCTVGVLRGLIAAQLEMPPEDIELLHNDEQLGFATHSLSNHLHFLISLQAMERSLATDSSCDVSYVDVRRVHQG
eukprot:CAMPEP_0175958130 /NCGR_PEP_ID=MMETSP0108-20121206/34079_1 /TAXON_ID=195067 ORGANISM="Goniomonas pacifica, Strain CCMP1869" /NCGR_SAMPLE_ID=MMETSP0108 /ASSEMBLY_ACC=CAM_ASM_000204 /LENGTH=259 /DNA_ID=CAMNT_0017285455 /DNA_START=90 /DNA_END=870 /DNA_ORIENTATION=-